MRQGGAQGPNGPGWGLPAGVRGIDQGAVVTPAEITASLRAEAAALGFDALGVAPAGSADPEGRLDGWLAAGFQAEMGYMARAPEERKDPRLRMPEARSVVALVTSYHRPEVRPVGGLKLSRYCLSRDYHKVLRKRLRKLRRHLLSLCPGAQVYPTVDTSPVLERAWAARAGLVWIGKSTMAISRQLGTYTFLSTLITDIELVYSDAPVVDGCRGCTRCLDACPSGALVGPYQLDARRCIGYWTVEKREGSLQGGPDLAGWVAGCDICQEVCPYNRRAPAGPDPAFDPRPGLLRPDPGLFLQPDRRPELTALIAGTAIQRTGAEALQRNAQQPRPSSPAPGTPSPDAEPRP